MNEIQRASEKILDYLIARHSKDKNFLFVPRMRNTKGRLDAGYWFRGNDGYLQVSFWIGADGASGVYQIAFVYTLDNGCYIELSARQNAEARSFIQLVSQSLGIEFNNPRPNHYFCDYPGGHYLDNLTDFIENIKPRVDNLINTNNPTSISLPDQRFFQKYAGRVIARRQKQIEREKKDKICRVCWNDKNWIVPSGWENKNVGESFESEHGFGHEEWLLDRSKLIEGYHYAFLQSFLNQRKRNGKGYNITLITTPGDDKFYLVGKIKNVELISPEHSVDIYNRYKSEGWFSEMINDLIAVNADSEHLEQMQPQDMFNLRFRFDDYEPEEELVEISEKDVNLPRTVRYSVPYMQKEDIAFATDNDSDAFDAATDPNSFAGNLKNTASRKRSYGGQCEFDPVHDKMQNGLFLLFNSPNRFGYSNPKIERDRVDLKAIAESGNWHYFEIKTDPAKLSIRKALGQIIEYAMFPDRMRAEKYVVISQYKPSNDVVKYLRHIRNQYKIPVVYRYYDVNSNFLSEEYPEP